MYVKYVHRMPIYLTVDAWISAIVLSFENVHTLTELNNTLKLSLSFLYSTLSICGFWLTTDGDMKKICCAEMRWQTAGDKSQATWASISSTTSIIRLYNKN